MASVETFRSIADHKAGPVNPNDAMCFWLIAKGKVQRNTRNTSSWMKFVFTFNCLIRPMCATVVFHLHLLTAWLISHIIVFAGVMLLSLNFLKGYFSSYFQQLCKLYAQTSGNVLHNNQMVPSLKDAFSSSIPCLENFRLSGSSIWAYNEGIH